MYLNLMIKINKIQERQNAIKHLSIDFETATSRDGLIMLQPARCSFHIRDYVSSLKHV
jgi:hypothetical protein